MPPPPHCLLSHLVAIENFQIRTRHFYLNGLKSPISKTYNLTYCIEKTIITTLIVLSPDYAFFRYYYRKCVETLSAV